ncbi:uncharacterized protein YndB with AHSA1/START domain [Glaciihabitans tibetensis]|uniref:Uncharacterized protein YndB with AHSA1/START domain n=1 Tax=Glaciihabitans tibetensis TaxID=1266600 RepID=A0A2T0VE56_9MICO|nr:SRPBCC family protein [Glaciihabitans tibetensis]PRY68476.1 uncharacterized protein YndB with AHSA1/START domain [Glaciihabitans tibetensis]
MASAPIPTGRLFRAENSLYDLTLVRSFRAAPGALWEWITHPQRTAKWIGPWRGEAGTGRSIELQLTGEEGAPWTTVRIEDCEPPHLLAVSTVDDAGSMELQVRLTERNGETELTFVHHLTDPAAAESMGPGWEYYLDALVAAHNGLPAPNFSDYYPAQAEHFVAEARHALSRS